MKSAVMAPRTRSHERIASTADPPRPTVDIYNTRPPEAQRSSGVDAPCTRWTYVILKRVIDVPAAFVLLLVLAPVLVLLAAAIRLTSRGPVVFGHRRVGRHGCSFTCYKFRTMFADAERKLLADPKLRRRYVANDYKLPDGCDPRITGLGAFLRRTSLDELPQLFNVLRGDMSLVGPRPVVADELQWYGDRGDELLTAFPGLTGRWQVRGRSTVGYPERVGVELAYVREWSFWRDAAYLLRTVPAVLSRHGAH